MKGFFVCCIVLLLRDTKGDQVKTILSRGSMLEPVENVFLYDKMEQIYFPIPDIPDPPTLITPTIGPCVHLFLDSSFFDQSDHDKGFDPRCELFDVLLDALKEVQELYIGTNRVLTTKGLNSANIVNPMIPPDWMETIVGAEVNGNLPEHRTIEVAGETWFNETEARLAVRRFSGSGFSVLNHREKRWIANIAKPVLQFAAKTFGKKFLKGAKSMFHNLFVGENEILDFLTTSRAVTKDDYKFFTDLSARISQLEVETKESLYKILQDSDSLRSILSHIHWTHVSAFYAVFADLLNFQYVSNVYSLSFVAYEECRSSKLSPVIVPPELLAERLREIEKQLPADMELVIKLEDLQEYYTLPLAACTYDSNGGILSLGVPLAKKGSIYKLYQYSPVKFAYMDSTCMVQTPATFVIKDTGTNTAHVVTDVDEDDCAPERSLCRVPFSSGEDSNDFCITTMMTEQDAETVKTKCPLHCYKGKDMTISQYNDRTFVGTHIKTSRAKIVCPESTVTMEEDILYGSVRFTMPCDCQLEIDGKTVAKSSMTVCDEKLKPSMEVLFPIHFSTVSTIIPFSDAGDDKTSFIHVQEILDTQFQDSPSEKPEPDRAIEVTANVLVNFVQSLVTMYLVYRYHNTNALVMAMANRIPMAEASAYACKLSWDTNALLWAIFGCCLFGAMQNLIWFIYRFIKKTYTRAVDEAALRMQILQSPPPEV